MIRETSREAYRTIKAEGLLSKRRMDVYQAIVENGLPLTATQIAERMPGYKSSSVGTNIHARLCELRALGVVQEKGTTICPVTKMTVILWESTDKLPVKPAKMTRMKCYSCGGRGYLEQAKLL